MICQVSLEKFKRSEGVKFLVEGESVIIIKMTMLIVPITW